MSNTLGEHIRVRIRKILDELASPVMNDKDGAKAWIKALDDFEFLILSEAHRIGMEAIGEGQQLLIQIDDTEHANGAYASVQEQRLRLSKLTGASNE